MQVEKVLQDDRLEQIRAVIEENVNPDIWKKGDDKRSGGRDSNGGRHARLFAIKAEKKRLCVPPRDRGKCDGLLTARALAGSTSPAKLGARTRRTSTTSATPSAKSTASKA